MNNKSVMKHYLETPFILCVLVFVCALAVMPKLIDRLGVFFIKQALPLQKSLDQLNPDSLGPYKVVHKQKIENHAIEEALGTKDYIQWQLADTSQPLSSPVRYCSLFITYYTGNPDQVPHVPEECYTGGGSQRLGTEDIQIKLNGQDVKIPVRCLTFGTEKGSVWSDNKTFNVIYFFKVNGKYAGNRESCRSILQANLFSKYSYFSKVEWKFYGRSPLGGEIFPKSKEAKQATEKLLSVLVPELEKNHWPDWKKANRKQ